VDIIALLSRGVHILSDSAAFVKPVLDIKPYLPQGDVVGEATVARWVQMLDETA